MIMHGDSEKSYPSMVGHHQAILEYSIIMYQKSLLLKSVDEVIEVFIFVKVNDL